jgi:hypothetical protein
VFANVHALVFDNHEPWRRQLELARRALGIYRTLRAASVVEQVPGPDGTVQIRLTVDLQENFALNQPLSPFALAAFELLDPDSPTFALDVLSVVESTLDDPRPILSQQQFQARGEAVNAMKAEGIEYEERMELLEQVTYPKPLGELLDAAYEAYAAEQPWVRDFALSPKSVVRDMVERAMSFGEFVALYKLSRSEGLVLRYLSDAFRAARQTIPDEIKNEELQDLIEWLGELIRQVDSSLVDEWEELSNPTLHLTDEATVVPPAPRRLTANTRAFRVMVRNELFRRVQLAARSDWAALGELDSSSGFGADEWADAMDTYWDEHDRLGIGPDARGPSMLLITETPTEWRVRQIFDDPAGDHDFGISATIDLAESDDAGEAVVRITDVGMVRGAL